jgi:hypothetical protein
VSRTITSEYRSSARGPDELLEPLPDLVVPRSLSAKDARTSIGPPATQVVADAVVRSVAVQGYFAYFSEPDGYFWKVASGS